MMFQLFLFFASYNLFFKWLLAWGGAERLEQIVPHADGTASVCDASRIKPAAAGIWMAANVAFLFVVFWFGLV